MKKYKVEISEGQSGPWQIEKFEVSVADAKLHNLRCMFNCHGDSGIEPGTYTRLTWKGSVIMSDTPSEIRDHMEFIYEAKGRILITGLGIGMVTAAVCAKDNVEHVTVLRLPLEHQKWCRDQWTMV